MMSEPREQPRVKRGSLGVLTLKVTNRFRQFHGDQRRQTASGFQGWGKGRDGSRRRRDSIKTNEKKISRHGAKRRKASKRKAMKNKPGRMQKTPRAA